VLASGDAWDRIAAASRKRSRSDAGTSLRGPDAEVGSEAARAQWCAAAIAARFKDVDRVPATAAIVAAAGLGDVVADVMPLLEVLNAVVDAWRERYANGA
jgi:hypothetical protein